MKVRNRGVDGPVTYMASHFRVNMPFFKDLRRKKTNSKSDKSSSDSKSSKNSNGTLPTPQSSSTVDSLYGASTPSSSIQPQSSTPNLLHLKSTNGVNCLPPKSIALSPSKRNSVLVCCHLCPDRFSAAYKMMRSQSTSLTIH